MKIGFDSQKKKKCNIQPSRIKTGHKNRIANAFKPQWHNRHRQTKAATVAGLRGHSDFYATGRLVCRSISQSAGLFAGSINLCSFGNQKGSKIDRQRNKNDKVWC